MVIQDYDILKDIELLYKKRIVIYGAGNDGGELFNLLQLAGIEVAYFCDKDDSKRECLGCKIISLEQLKEMTTENEFLIIIASRKYREEIIKDLEVASVDACVCTATAVNLAFDFHIDHNKHFSKEFVKYYITKRDYLVYCDMNRKFVSQYQSLIQQNNPILNFQAGKVGSSTIAKTLNMYGKNNVQLHCMMNFDVWNNKHWGAENGKALAEQALFFKQNMYRSNWKIISMVRDPIARSISAYMQRTTDRRATEKTSNDFEQDYRNKIYNELEKNLEFEWFDKELKELCDIDIYEYPFNKEKGYTIIKKNNIEILLLKLEKLNENEDVIGKFVDISEFKLQNANVGNEKETKYIYKAIKERLQIPHNLLEQQYVYNEKMNHFYTEEERQVFLKKWERY